MVKLHGQRQVPCCMSHGDGRASFGACLYCSGRGSRRDVLGGGRTQNFSFIAGPAPHPDRISGKVLPEHRPQNASRSYLPPPPPNDVKPRDAPVFRALLDLESSLRASCWTCDQLIPRDQIIHSITAQLIPRNFRSPTRTSHEDAAQLVPANECAVESDRSADVWPS